MNTNLLHHVGVLVGEKIKKPELKKTKKMPSYKKSDTQKDSMKTENYKLFLASLCRNNGLQQICLISIAL